MIFVNSMSDLFHEDVPDEFIDRVFAVMALAKKHVFQVLTKRPERMRHYMARLGKSAKLLDAGEAEKQEYQDKVVRWNPELNATFLKTKGGGSELLDGVEHKEWPRSSA